MKTNAVETVPGPRRKNPENIVVRKFQYKPGSIIIVPPNVPNSFENYSNEIVQLSFIEQKN